MLIKENMPENVNLNLISKKRAPENYLLRDNFIGALHGQLQTIKYYANFTANIILLYRNC